MLCLNDKVNNGHSLSCSQAETMDRTSILEDSEIELKNKISRELKLGSKDKVYRNLVGRRRKSYVCTLRQRLRQCGICEG